MVTKGEQLIQSLRDGRNVWLDGKRVEDIQTHPAFAGTLQTLKKLFDMLSTPGWREKIGYPSPATGAYVHSAFLVPRTKEDLWKRKLAFQIWANETYGMMSRLSEYARSLVTGWYASREAFRKYDPRFPDKLERYYESARDGDRVITTALGNPQIDRAKEIYGTGCRDVYLRIVRKTEDGVYLQGAKMLATAAPYAHDVIVVPNHRLPDTDADLAQMMIVPLNAPGVHILCRESFASDDAGKHPLSARFDEMDAVIVFDDAFVPWERVLIHDNPEAVWQFHTQQKSNTLANHQTVVRLIAKLEFVAGVAFAIAEAIGVNSFLNVQEKLGELVIQLESIKGLLVAAEAQSAVDAYGVLLPAAVPLQTARNLGLRYYARAVEILQQIGAGGFVQIPSVTSEQSSERIRPYVREYFRGATVAADEKIKLFRLAWDLIGSPLGSRHELYERYYTGDPLRMYSLQYLEYEGKLDLKKKLDLFWKTAEQKEVKNDGSKTAVLKQIR